MRTFALVLALVFTAGVAFAAHAAPALGPDCGLGASIVGTNESGRIVIGTDSAYTCTLTFSGQHPNILACLGMNETNGGGSPGVIGARVNGGTSVLFDGNANNSMTIFDGDTITYLCK